MRINLQLQHIHQALSSQQLKDFRSTTKSAQGKLRKLVYTSMDGDDMKYVDFIRVFVYQQGYIPVNPIATLGYYTSTIGHQGQKKEIIKDCYSLMLACSELWVFGKYRPGFDHLTIDEKTIPPADLSEGILAEMLVWAENKPNAPIKTFTWKDVGIPKYVKTKQWALTSKESIET